MNKLYKSYIKRKTQAINDDLDEIELSTSEIVACVVISLVLLTIAIATQH
jgi:hypothetical protein